MSSNYTINGTSADDSLNGSSGDDTLSGFDGNDILVGGLGSDTLNGGAGNDTLTSDAASGARGSYDRDVFVFGDVQNESIGNDVITDFDVNGFNGGEVSFDTLSLRLGAQDFELSTGSDIVYFAQVLAQDGNANTAAFSDGQDIIFVFGRDSDGAIINSIRLEGVIGDDGLTGGSDQNFVVIGPYDLVFAGDNTGSQTFVGGAGNDQIDGSAGNDFIDGGNGGDTIIISAGNDFLIGGAGSDTFVISDIADGATSQDVIDDFEIGVDVLDVSGLAGVSSFDDLFITTNDSGNIAIFISDTQSLTLNNLTCLLYTSPSPRDQRGSRMPSSA